MSTPTSPCTPASPKSARDPVDSQMTEVFTVADDSMRLYGKIWTSVPDVSARADHRLVADDRAHLDARARSDVDVAAEHGA